MEPSNNETGSDETRVGESHPYNTLIKESQEKKQYAVLGANFEFNDSGIDKKPKDNISDGACSSECYVIDKDGYGIPTKKLNQLQSHDENSIYIDLPANVYRNPEESIYHILDPGCDDNLSTKHCCVEWIKENKRISAVIGSMAFIILVLVIVIVIVASTVPKPNNKDLNEGDVACSWSDWTTWTDCPLLPFKGTQQRTKYLIGPEGSCKPNETVQTQTCEDTRFNFDLKYDTALVNPELFLTKDNTVLSNYQIDVRDNNGLLQNYSGATADHCLTPNSKLYFVVAYNVTVIKDNFDGEGTVLFEAAFSDREQVDTFPYVGQNPNGWSFNVYHQRFDSYALAAQRFTDEKILKIFQVANGATITGKLEILVDRERDELSLVDGSRVEHVFRDFKSDNLMCPMFGLYGDGKVKMSLQIRDAKNLTDLFHHFWT